VNNLNLTYTEELPETIQVQLVASFNVDPIKQSILEPIEEYYKMDVFDFKVSLEEILTVVLDLVKDMVPSLDMNFDISMTDEKGNELWV
jgi:hypothetical protein